MKRRTKPLTVVKFRRFPSDGVMETLKNATAMAKAEGFSGIAIAAIDMKGFSYTVYSTDNYGALVGALERVKYRILNAQNDE